MNELQIFNNETFGSVRVIMQNDEPWFVAKDVCEILELDVFKVNQRLDNDLLSKYVVEDSLGRKSNVTIWNESALYDAIFESRKPEARAFRKWVMEEVLPSIRKTGGYHMVPKSLPEALRAYALEVEKRERLAIECDEAKAAREAAEAARDEAIRTKALIGSKREASAMAKASNLSRENGKLKVVNENLKTENDDLKNRIGEGDQYKQVRAIPWLLKYFEDKAGMYIAVGKKLRDISLSLGLEVKKIPDSRYNDGVKAYHMEAIEELHQRLEDRKDFMQQYRKPTIVISKNYVIARGW